MPSKTRTPYEASNDLDYSEVIDDTMPAAHFPVFHGEGDAQGAYWEMREIEAIAKAENA